MERNVIMRKLHRVKVKPNMGGIATIKTSPTLERG